MRALALLFPVDVSPTSLRLCSVSFAAPLDLSCLVVDPIMVPVRDLVPLVIIVDRPESFVLIAWCLDESAIVCVDVVKSVSVVVKIDDAKDDVGDATVRLALVDLVVTLSELRGGNKRW